MSGSPSPFARASRRLGSRGGSARSVPCNDGDNLTLVASPRLQGIVAAMLAGGALDGRLPAARVLVPALRLGELIILDNLSVHPRASIQATAGRVLLLPGYSTDFNLVAQASGEPTDIPGGSAPPPRAALDARLARTTPGTTLADATRDLRHCRYVN